jgi:hypothetical protein
MGVITKAKYKIVAGWIKSKVLNQILMQAKTQSHY